MSKYRLVMNVFFHSESRNTYRRSIIDKIVDDSDEDELLGAIEKAMKEEQKFVNEHWHPPDLNISSSDTILLEKIE